jgi:hypothetical protein
MRDPGGDRAVVDPEQPGRGDGAEDVYDVEASTKPRLQLEAFEAESGACRRDLEIDGVDDAELDRLLAESPQLVRETATMRVRNVDRGAWAVAVHVGLGEEPALRVEVLLHRAVKVEVVLAQVGEDQHPEADAEQALQGGAVGGGLERARAVARVQHLAEGALEIDRLAGRPGGRAALSADAVLDRAEEPGTTPCGREDGEEEKGGRRLPVRAGDAGDLELPRRVSEESIGSKSHGFSGVADEELGRRQLERPLDDERGRPVGDGVGGELVSVGLVTGHADEEGPGCDAAGVVGQVGDLDAGGVERALRAHSLAQAVEVDGAGF